MGYNLLEIDGGYIEFWDFNINLSNNDMYRQLHEYGLYQDYGYYSSDVVRVLWI